MSYEVVKISLPKINTETKQIINAINRSNLEEYPDIPNPETIFPSVAHGNEGYANNNQTASDRNEVANIMLATNPFNLNAWSLFFYNVRIK